MHERTTKRGTGALLRALTTPVSVAQLGLNAGKSDTLKPRSIRSSGADRLSQPSPNVGVALRVVDVEVDQFCASARHGGSLCSDRQHRENPCQNS